MKRKSNQDSICLYPAGLFFAVADGMGGHNGGDIASQLTTSLLPELLQKYANLEAKQLLVKIIQEVNQSILLKASESPELKGMGTTLSCILYRDSHLYIANVGDSRVYLVHNQKLFQLTRDHSLVQEKINMGVYTREQGHEDPQKNVLIRTVGFDEDLQVDVFNYKISKNDMFLICSDGLHGKVTDHDIIYLVNETIPEPQKATLEITKNLTQKLIQCANDNGGQDNISVIVSIAQG